MADKPVSMEVAMHFGQLLAREARLLNQFQYDEWVNLLHPDIHYSVPSRRSHTMRANRDSDVRRISLDHYDDDLRILKMKIKRLQHPGPSSVDPRPREVRVVSNIEVFNGDRVDDYLVYSVIVLYRNRLLDEDGSIAGSRADVWRGSLDDGFKLYRRTVEIAQNTMLLANMNGFL